jgi:aspartate racemase
MESIPVNFADVHACINGDIDATHTLVQLANDGIRRLSMLGVHHIAVPCNSLHVLWDEFVVPEGTHLLHIAEPVVRRLVSRGHQRIGIMASALTISHDVYFSRLRDAAIECVSPSPALQARLNHELAAFVRCGEVPSSAHSLFNDITREFQTQQVDALVLACTDIATMLERGRFSPTLPMEDSLDALAQSCARYTLAPNAATA